MLKPGGWLICTLWIPVLSCASPLASDDWPDWANAEEAVRQRIASVNEGDLHFLSREPERKVHHHRNRILITNSSLTDGWVRLEQCHDNLDRVGAAQILYNADRSRGLEVLSHKNIDQVYAKENTVQLRGIHAASEVCIGLESQALRNLDPGVFELQNGPFMRRFLDGYYPLRVSLRIDYPASLALADFSPDSQQGFEVEQSPGQVAVEALFEGELRTRFRFFSVP